MNKLRIFAATLLSLSLAGCAQPLTQNEVQLTADPGEWAYSLVGDDAIISGKVDFLSENGSKYVLALQAKSSTDEWVTESKKEDLTGEVESKFALKLDAEADKTVRVAILDSADKVLVASAEAVIVVKDLKRGISDIEYYKRIACGISQKKCFEAYFAFSYPGLLNLSARQKNELFNKYTWVSGTAPNLESIQADPNWVVPSNSCPADKSSLDLSKPLPGRTFNVQSSGSDPITYHVTYLKGRFYDYPNPC
jgi:hypothetical protein